MPQYLSRGFECGRCHQPIHNEQEGFTHKNAKGEVLDFYCGPCGQWFIDEGLPVKEEK